MIISASLEWEITTSSSTTPLNRFYHHENCNFYLQGENLYYIIKKNEQMYLQACDSVLPFQILYDQGVITGFVWQVDQQSNISLLIYFILPSPRFVQLEKSK